MMNLEAGNLMQSHGAFVRQGRGTLETIVLDLVHMWPSATASQALFYRFVPNFEFKPD